MYSLLLSSYMFALSCPNYSTADDGYFLSLSVLVCWCVHVLFPACFGRLVNKALWETVCCALSRITKATEPLPPWSWHFRELYECVCVCLYGFKIKANVNTTERKMHGGFPRKHMHVQNTNVRSSYKFRGKCFSYRSDADLYRFLCFCLVLSLHTCSAVKLLCVCCEQSLKVFSDHSWHLYL